MDSSDPDITFDARHVYNHCLEFETVPPRKSPPNEEKRNRWAAIVEQIKAAEDRRDYGSILGLSGSVDKSDFSVKVYEWRLRPLVVHVNTG